MKLDGIWQAGDGSVWGGASGVILAHIPEFSWIQIEVWLIKTVAGALVGAFSVWMFNRFIKPRLNKWARRKSK